MYLEAHDHLSNPIRMEITRLVVYDDTGTPIMLGIKYAPNFMCVAHCKDKEFHELLLTMGVNRTVIVDTIDPTKLKPITAKR